MAFEKLRSLRCFPEVDKKIRAGIPCENVAEWIQDEQGEYSDVKVDSVSRQLYRYKESIPSVELDEPEGLYIRKKIETLKRGVNEANELEKLYLLQLSRISLLVQQEDKIKFTQKQTRMEIEVARQLLLDMAKLKMDLGVYTRTPGEVNVNHGTRELEGIDPERRKAMGEVAAKLLTELNKAIRNVDGDETPPVLVGSGDSHQDVEDADYEIVGKEDLP